MTPSEDRPRYGEPEEVAPGVRRITCRNPSPMTFTGTQTYLIGEPEGPVAVVDPGPEDPAHLAAIRAAAPGGIGAILVTHSHRDHSGGAAALAAAVGWRPEILAFGAHGAGMSETMRALAAAEAGAAIGGGEGADPGFAPDRLIGDGEVAEVAGLRIRAHHTPGHLSNHLSFEIEGEGLVFTGDTVMGWASTLVSPPDGDMAQFMASLDRLEGLSARLFLPGHGPAIGDPAAAIADQRAHRLARRDATLAALAPGPATAGEITARVYTDIAPALWPMAERNVLATMIWQMGEGRVAAEGPVSARARFRLMD